MPASPEFESTPPFDGPDDEAQSSGGNGKSPAIVAVRYGAMSWVGEFSYRRNMEFSCCKRLVIQTERGIEIGERVNYSCGPQDPWTRPEQSRLYVKNSGQDFCRPRAGRVLREATHEDVNEHRHLNANIQDDINTCARFAKEQGLDMHVVTAEHLLGGERIVFYFRAESRVDFRQLVKELAHHYQTRIEMRQVGARDEARLVADWEVCGRECCCRNFLKKLHQVSMKMAKLQKSTLDPSKVSGRCGRLRCCLRYEHEGYEELAKKLPRRNMRVQTPDGEGVVVDKQVLTQLVMVHLDDDAEKAFPLDELTVLGPAGQTPPPKDRQPAAREAAEPIAEKPPVTAEQPTAAPTGEEGDEAGPLKKRRRRRGSRGKRARRLDADGQPTEDNQTPTDGDGADEAPSTTEASREGTDDDSREAQGEERRSSSRRRRRRRPRKRSDGPAGENASQS